VLLYAGESDQKCAKLIAETQNGNISLSTSEEDGTTITIHLPI
jgi:hypothetical protein